KLQRVSQETARVIHDDGTPLVDAAVWLKARPMPVCGTYAMSVAASPLEKPSPDDARFGAAPLPDFGSLRTSSDGAFELRKSTALVGPQVLIESVDGLEHTLRHDEQASPESRSSNQYRAPRASTVEGRVRVDGESPDSPLAVALEPIDLRWETSARSVVLTERDGAFRMTGLLSGRYWLAVQPPGSRASTRQDLALKWDRARDADSRQLVELRSGSTTRLDLEIASRATFALIACVPV